MSSINRALLMHLKDGERWAGSIPSLYAAHLQTLIDRGRIERCSPPHGKGRNMLRLTDKGRQAVLARDFTGGIGG